MVNIGPIEAAGGMTPISRTRLEATKPSGGIPNSIPVDRVEIIRLFSREQVEAIRQGLYGLQIRKERP